MDEFVRRGHRPEGGQPEAGELLRLLVPRPGLAQRRRVHLERRRRPRRPGRRRVGGQPVRARVDRRASRPSSSCSSEASGAPKDGNEADPQIPFCNGEIGMMSTPGWVTGLINDPDDRLPRHDEERRRLRAARAPTARPRRCCSAARTSRSPAKSPNQDLARKAVALMLSDEYQTILAENGLTPAKTSLAPLLGDDEFAQATIAAASNAKLTPAAPGWADGRGVADPGGLLRRGRQRRRRRGARRGGRRADDRRAQLTHRSHGTAGAVQPAAPAVPCPDTQRLETRDHARDDQARTGGPAHDRDGAGDGQQRRAASRPAPRTRCPYGLLVPAVARPAARARLPAGPPGRAVLPGVRPRPAVRPAGRVGRPARTTPSCSRDRYLWTVVAALGRLLPGQRGGDDGDRRGGRAADAADGEAGPAARAERPAAGLGDAGARGADGLAVAVRHPVRRHQLAARPGSAATSRATRGCSSRCPSSSSPP